MSKKVKPSIPRGMRDILPDQMVKRQYVIDVIREVFESFGFDAIQTPAIEKAETLLGKYGSEAERLIYSASYGGDREKLMLRYDLSVPLCRFVAMYPEIPRPFKRYHIAPVWRADRPQKGRFREFYQCDADTVGSSSMLGDAETVAVIYTILYRLGFRKFTTHINNRKLLNGIGQYAGVPDSVLRGLYQSIDKLLKIGLEGVREELLSVGLPQDIQDSMRRVARLYLQGEIALDEIGPRLRLEEVADPAYRGEEAASRIPFPADVAAVVEPVLRDTLARTAPGSVKPELLQAVAGELIASATPALREIYAPVTELIPVEAVDRMLALLQVQGDNRTILSALRAQLAGYPDALEGIDELAAMFHYLDLLGVPETHYRLDPSMARGLEYYTGPIYETIVEEANIGSITGGGRFDNLVGMFLGQSVPATGTTIGIERIIVVMDELGLFPPNVGTTTTEVLVTVFGSELVDASLEVAVELRKSGHNTQVYFDPAPLREQLGYAVKKGIPYVVIVGPDEAAAGQVTVKCLSRNEQRVVSRDELSRAIRDWRDA